MNKRNFTRLQKASKSGNFVELQINGDKLYTKENSRYWENMGMAAYFGTVSGGINHLSDGHIEICANDEHHDDWYVTIPLDCITGVTTLGSVQELDLPASNSNYGRTVEFTMFPSGQLTINGCQVSKREFSQIARAAGWVYSSDPFKNCKLPRGGVVTIAGVHTLQFSANRVKCGCVDLSRENFEIGLDWVAKQWGYL